jgi:hypothetical protein
MSKITSNLSVLFRSSARVILKNENVQELNLNMFSQRQLGFTRNSPSSKFRKTNGCMG